MWFMELEIFYYVIWVFGMIGRLGEVIMYSGNIFFLISGLFIFFFFKKGYRRVGLMFSLGG